MPKSHRITTCLKWILNAAILAYFTVFCLVIFSKGHGFDFNALFFRISAHEPGKPFLILSGLTFVRFLIGLERKNAALLIASVFFSFFLVEMAFRILDLQVTRYPSLKAWRQPSSNLGWELIPDVQGKAQLGSRISINSHGLRDRERPWTKTNGEHRILGLGDSFTFGYGLELEDTYLKQIERLIHARGLNTDVINAGVIGYNLFQSLTYFKMYGIKYNPDIILYFFYFDDVGGLNNPDTAKAFSHDFRISSEYKKKPHGGMPNFHLVNFLTNVNSLAKIKFRTMASDADWIKTIEDRRKFILKNSVFYLTGECDLTPFKEHLAELGRISNEKGMKLMVVLIPDSIQINNPPLQKINQIVRDTCVIQEIPIVDIAPVFENESDLLSLYLFPFDAHTSTKGNKIIAREVYEKFQELSWLP